MSEGHTIEQLRQRLGKEQKFRLHLEKKIGALRKEKAQIEKSYWEIHGHASKGYSDLILSNIQLEKTKINLHETNARFESTLKSIGDGVIATDSEGKIIFINRVAENLTGWKAEKAVNQSFESVFQITSNKTKEVAANLVNRLFHEKTVLNVEDYILVNSRDGKKYPIAGRASSILDTQANLIGAVVVFQDNTECILEEKRKEELHAQLKQSEKMQAIGQLAGGVAHDFNNQLTGIVGYADMLLEMVSNNAILCGYVNKILTSAERASDLTEQLLAFSRKGKFKIVPVNIHTLIDEVASILIRSIDKKIKLKQDLKANLPVVMGDPTQLQNVLLNIGINARDAMPHGGEIIIATDVVKLDDNYCDQNSEEIEPGNYVRIRVTDTGIGIDEETKNHIFEPFFTTKENGSGVGMGLAAAYGTVKNHKGIIDVYSEVGRGTTFNVYLPIAVTENDLSQNKATIKSIKGSGRILIVDDEEMVRNIASDMLHDLGYEVTVCNDGLEAVEYYKTSWKNIDMVMLDLVMPGMSGKEVLIEMLKINPDVITLLISGYSVNGEAQELFNKGAKGFIQKPFRKGEISHIIAKMLYLKK